MMTWVIRLVLGLLSLVALAAIVLFALGRRPGAGTTRASVFIDRSPDQIWPWLHEPERLKQWVSWLVDVRDATPGEPQVGSRAVWVMDDPMMKQRLELTDEVIRVEPGRLVEAKISMPGGFTGTSSLELAAEGAGTRVTAHGRFTYLDPFARFMEPLVTPEAQKKAAGDLARLKQRVEASGAAVR